MKMEPQDKKLNKDDHKGITQAAKITKGGVALLSVIAVTVPFIKKHGKDILDIAKTIILKK